MVFVKYKVADNAMAKLALPLDENTTHMTIKDAVNIPESWIWIATLAEYEGDQLVRMEKVKVSNKNWNVLTIERGFESNPLQWEIDTPVFLNVTAEVIRDIQEAIDQGNPESERNKKQSIEPNKSSNTFYPTVKAVWDWVTGLLNKKADLIDGKVPASQLPEMQAIDESNLVHKSWNEEISGFKKFIWGLEVQCVDDSNVSKFEKSSKPTATRYLRVVDFVNTDATRVDQRQQSTRIYMPVANWWYTSLERQEALGLKNLEFNEDWSVKKRTSYKAINTNEFIVNNQNRTGEWQQRTPTNWSSTITNHHCRYKKIGKICHFIAQVYVSNVAGNTPWFTLPVPRANYGTEFVVAGYCVKRGENPATQSRGAISFSGQDRVFTLWETDVSAFTQPWDYIIRASGSYETA